MTAKILHITAHLGGGVGTVLLNYLAKVKGDRTFTHRVVCLDYANQKAIEVAKSIGLELFDERASRTGEICDMIADSDIVLMHWWGHQMMSEFLNHTLLPPCRVIIWSHQSGLYPPNVFTKVLLRYPDVFVFCTPISYNSKVVQAFKHKLRVIAPTSGIERLKDVRPKPHEGFNIGYLGTVDYKKLHPKFLTICDQVAIPNVKFIVCGVPNGEQLKKEAEELGISHKFVFTGRVPDITPYLAIFDLFGYPLAPYHYGARDQVLEEVMVAGLAPVVLDNPMERHMIEDSVTGIVATDIDAYIDALETLYRNPKLRNELSRNARQNAIQSFSLDKMICEWNTIFSKMLKKEGKHARRPIKKIPI
jgi:glycosyltransferase involved in cell wall biosynthesis